MIGVRRKRVEVIFNCLGIVVYSGCVVCLKRSLYSFFVLEDCVIGC